MTYPNLHFQSSKDLAFIKARDKERYGYQQQRHRIFFVQPEDLIPVPDPVAPADHARVNIWGEPDEDTSTTDGPATALYSDPVTMPIHIAMGEEIREADRFGLDREIDLIAVFSIAVLEDLGIDYRDRTQGPKIGDRLDFLADGVRVNQYELLTAIERDYWGNTQYPLHLICAAVLTREPITI